jgi:hypothetical protein
MSLGPGIPAPLNPSPSTPSIDIGFRRAFPAALKWVVLLTEGLLGSSPTCGAKNSLSNPGDRVNAGAAPKYRATEMTAPPAAKKPTLYAISAPINCYCFTYLFRSFGTTSAP